MQEVADVEAVLAIDCPEDVLIGEEGGREGGREGEMEGGRAWSVEKGSMGDICMCILMVLGYIRT